jgi:CubicO group peptidase (beta-lactamase class C family)
VTAALLCSLLLLQGPHQSGPNFASIGPLVERGIRQGVYPGAVVVVGRRDTVLYARGFGHLSWARGAPRPSARDTRWDLASLTKVVATASAAMVLVDEGRLELDAPVAKYLPRFTGEGRELITVRMLLDHTSGLRAYLPFYRLVSDRAAALELLYREPPIRIPGVRPEYSDLNAILLGLVVEAVSGESLDAFASREVFAPLRLQSTVFAPALTSALSVAPSWSRAGHPVPGRVNDDNANLLGGVAGHAGLFSTGDDIARFAQAWLSEGATADGPWVKPTLLREFLQRSTQSGTRMLGWDTPEQRGRTPSIYGHLAGPRTFGHSGWTGTMLWIDPTRDLFLVFLTNRSLEPRARRSITALHTLRTSLSDLVLRLAPALTGTGRRPIVR